MNLKLRLYCGHERISPILSQNIIDVKVKVHNVKLQMRDRSASLYVGTGGDSGTVANDNGNRVKC